MAIGRVFPNEIDRIFKLPGGPIGKEVRATAIQIAIEAQRLTVSRTGKHPGDRPRTGNLARSWKVRVVGSSTNFEVYNTKKYAASQELGALPHQIRARKVSHLQFKGRDGRWRRVKMVQHPGNPALYILRDAAIKVAQSRYGSVRVT